MGRLWPEDVPNVASDALERGLDSPGLRYLAGLQRPTSRDIGNAFDETCSQLGIAPATIWNATQIARRISDQILNGTLDPVEGWYQLPGDIGPLSVFFEFADRWGSMSFDEQFRARMIGAAMRFQSLSWTIANPFPTINAGKY